LFDVAELWVGFMCSCREAISHYPVVIAGGVRFINYGVLVDPERVKRDFKYNAPMTVSKLLAGALRNPQLGAAIRMAMPDFTPMGKLFARDALLEMPDAPNKRAYVESLVTAEDIEILTCSLRSLRRKYLAAGRKREQRDFIEGIIEEIAKDRRLAGKTDFSRLKRARMVQDMRERAASKD
jgi:hypothetical protein